MDIRKPKIETEVHLNDTKGNGTTASYKAGVIDTADAKVMLPPAVQTKLTALGKKYGVPFDLANIGFDGKMAENITALRKIVDMAKAESKLLPEMIKLIRSLMRSEIKLAKFHKLVTKASIKHQEKIDKETADIFLAMAGYGSRSIKREHRTNVRNALKEKRTEAYSNYYNNSVFGDESRIIDAEFETLESNRKILIEGKTQRIQFDAKQKQKVQEYVNSAFED